MTADFVEGRKEKRRASPSFFPSPFTEMRPVIPRNTSTLKYYVINEIRNVVISSEAISPKVI
jgi:hypothetical protein